MLGGCAGYREGAVRQPFFARVGKPLGIQLYMLGEEIGDDLPATFASVKAMGFDVVELSKLYGLPASAVRKAADNAGLSIASMHVLANPIVDDGRPTLSTDTSAVADIAGELGVAHVVVTVPMAPDGFAIRQGEDFSAAMKRAFAHADKDYWKRMAARFSGFGETMHRHGVQLAYHNHNFEFVTLDETSAFGILVEESDPDRLKFQLDIGWTVTAGEDARAWLDRLSGRLASVHLKDVAIGAPQAYYLDTRPAQIGTGQIDWTSVLQAADASGAQYYFVEQEPPFTMPRSEAAARSARFLRALVA